ncbi:MAG: hypothetical protein LBS00_00870 [Synergistaceae bacterium]|jgi:hypothetical protein|nr:hypothetical protein [Synergistaceae bacterium]
MRVKIGWTSSKTPLEKLASEKLALEKLALETRPEVSPQQLSIIMLPPLPLSLHGYKKSS